MKKHIPFIFGFALLLSACTEKPYSLIGHWTVDKVNVQFDENRSTPELVKQIGKMEQQNSFNIDEDSLLVFKDLEASWQGRIHLSNDTLYCDDTLFGIWKDEVIVTQTDSPLGEIIITYQKK